MHSMAMGSPVPGVQTMLQQLREAIHGLYCGIESIQRPADAWLQNFRSAAGSWRVCVQLLDAPHLQEHECYFAANNIKAACQKHQDMLEPGTLRELLPKLALHMQACLHKQQWPCVVQLAAAAAAAAVRAPSLQPASIVQDLQAIFLTAPAAAAAAAAAAATAAAAAAAVAAHNSSSTSSDLAGAAAAAGGPQGYLTQVTEAANAAAVAAAAAAASSLSHQTLGLHLQQDPVMVAAVLQLLGALPEAVLSKQTSVHPDRRTAVSDSLKQSAWPAPVLRAALCSQNTKLLLLACEAIVSWCELGVPPQGMEAQADALDVLAAAVLGQATAVKASEAFAAMLVACKESSSGSSTSSGPSTVLLLQLLQQLQHSVLPALAAEHHTMGTAAAAAAGLTGEASAAATHTSAAAADAAAYSSVVRSHFGPDAEAAFCRVLCAAAAALLRPVLQGAVQLQGLLELLLQQLLLCVGVSEDGVAMTAVDFWQDSYLATLQALPQDRQGLLLVQQQPVLEALTAVLVQRTQLSPAAAAAATADARDLPEEMRMVRRELASALRDIGSLLGPAAMLSFITQLTASHYQHLCSTHAAANPRCSSTTASTASPGGFLKPGLGLQGIAAGLAAGADVFGTTGEPRWGPIGSAAASHGAAAASDACALAQHMHAQLQMRVGSPAGVACASGCVAGDWLPLESALYAANVVLGKQRGEAAEQQVQQLVQYAAAAVSHPGGSLKLAGTALTLLGGLASWLPDHPHSLPPVLPAVSAALRSPDDKLSRNAATCAQRLTSCDGLAVLLAQGQPQFVQQLLQEYQRRGGLATRADAAQGDDKPTEELLLLCLCSLAVAHSSNSSDMDSILLQLVGPQLNAATEELTATLHGNWPQQQQQQHHVGSGSLQHLQQQVLQQPASGPAAGRLQQQRQQQYVHSTAVSCFKALASLVAGLPTGVSRQTIGVPMHSRHPRHQQQLLLQQQQHHAAAKAGGVRHQHLASAAAPAAARVDEDDASMCSLSVASDISGSAAHALHVASAGLSPAAAAVLTGSQWLQCQEPDRCSHAYCHSHQHHQQQHKEQAEAAAAQLRQHQACFIVSQLLRRASQPVMLALRAAAAAAEQEHRHALAQQLLSSTCSFLLAALPAAVQLQQQLLVQSPTGAAHAGSGSSSTSRIAEAAAAAAGSAGDRQQGSSSEVVLPGLLLVQLCQLLEQLPVQLLQQGCCLQLLCSSVAAAAASGALPSVDAHADPAADAFPKHAQTDTQQQQLLGMLQGLVSKSLAAACGSITMQAGGADPDLTSAALGLATVCLQQCPAVLAAADLDSLLAMTLTATQTYHLKQCTAVLEWVQVLVQAAYASTQQQQQQQQQGLANQAAAAAAAADSRVAALSALQQRLEAGGIGPQLVLALLLAAAGAMPPDVVLPVSFCLHSVWLSAGRLFEGWLQAAVLQLAPEAAPWQRQRHGAKITFVAELTDPACLSDTTRFKRILKNFCGGKKKGAGAGRHV